jgi:peptidoglycan/LPS O-acetylase OafA/YrhL
MALTALGAWHGANAALFVFVNPLVRLSEFVLGISIGLRMRDGWRPPFSLPQSCFALILALLVARLSSFDYPAADILLLGPFAAILAAAAAHDLAGLGGWLQSRALVYLGKISFAFYLVHELVIINLLHALGWRNPRSGMQDLGNSEGAALASLVVVVALILASLLHHWVEIPCQRRLLRSVT